MNSLEKLIRKISIVNGVILGLIITGLSILSFYFITSIAESSVSFLLGPLVISKLIPIVLIAVFCFTTRKRIGGYWNLRQATTGIFIMFVIAYAIQTVGYDIIFTKVTPNMVKRTEDAFIKGSLTFKNKPGADVKQIDKNIAEIKAEFANQKNAGIGNTIQGVFISIIFIFVFALVFAALFKREPPAYATVISEENKV